MSDHHDRYRDDVAAYALGALGHEETEALERHLQDCAACARDLVGFRAVVARFATAVEPHPDREQLRQEMLRAADDESRPPDGPS